MATEYDPKVGDWYSNVGGETFEIVAMDPDDETLEIQYFDGTVEELDLDTWYELELVPVEPPEDWSGSMDVERDDYGVDPDKPPVDPWTNPLDSIDREE